MRRDITEVLAVLVDGAYIRAGDTGRNQLWEDGELLEVVQPHVIRALRAGQFVAEQPLTVAGIPRQAFVITDAGRAALFVSSRPLTEAEYRRPAEWEER